MPLRTGSRSSMTESMLVKSKILYLMLLQPMNGPRSHVILTNLKISILSRRSISLSVNSLCDDVFVPLLAVMIGGKSA